MYADEETMAVTDLVVQCVTMSEISRRGVPGTAGGGRAWHGSRRVARRHRRLVPQQFRLSAADRWPVRDASVEASGSVRGRRDRQLPRVHGGPDRPRARAPDHGGHGGLHAAHRAVLGAARRSQRRARHDDAPGPAVPPVAPPDHIARGLDAAVGGRAGCSSPHLGTASTCCAHDSVRTIIERGMLWASRTESA